MDPDYQPVTDWWRVQDVPEEYCTAHQIVRICDQCGGTANAFSQTVHDACRIVISPIMGIYKYENEVLLPFFPNAFRSPLDPKPYGISHLSEGLTNLTDLNILLPAENTGTDSANPSLWTKLDGTDASCSCKSSIRFPIPGSNLSEDDPFGSDDLYDLNEDIFDILDYWH